MSPWTAFALVAVAGAVLAAASALGVRAAGGHPRMARRLAGAREARVGALLDRTDGGGRPVRVTGRIRCRDPLLIGADRLVAYHRDVEVLLERIGWRSVERLREARSFDLWDHDGSLTVDPSLAAEPLIVLPKVWRGDPSELEEPHASAVARLAERQGPATEARAVTRGINVTDRLLLLARASRDDSGRARLEPPDGGYLITNLDLDDAMRLLGGRNRRRVSGAIIGLAISMALLAIGGIGAFLSAMLAA